MIPGSKGHAVHACMKSMTLGPAKHEKVAIFRRKMSGFRMFLGFRERETRRNPLVSRGQRLLAPTS